MKTSINLAAPWGDVVDTIKHSKSLSEWYNNEHPILNYNSFRLPDYYSFDLKEMQAQISNILHVKDTIPSNRDKDGKKYSRYKGLGFFARKNSNNPLEDHFVRRDHELGEVHTTDLHLSNRLPDLYEDDFTSATSIYNDYFKQVFSKFKKRITKASLLELKSKGYLGSHVDFPYYKNIRLHATIFGGETSYYEIAGEKFQIPPDGHWYFIDTGKYHSIWNHGPGDRLTININLTDIMSDPKKLAEDLEL